jgi:hypothetical protein
MSCLLYISLCQASEHYGIYLVVFLVYNGITLEVNYGGQGYELWSDEGKEFFFGKLVTCAPGES